MKNLLQQINDFDVKIADLETKQNALKKQYVEENFPYKKGDVVEIKPPYNSDKFV